MTTDALLFPIPYDAAEKPVRISWEVWNRLLRAAEVYGGLILERYNQNQSRAFARAVRAALEPPSATPARYAAFTGVTADPGLKLRVPEARPQVDAALALFEQASGVLVQRATEAALRVIPAGTAADAGTSCRKAPVDGKAGTRGLSASEVLGPGR